MMVLKEIILSNFRNFERRSFDFSPNLTLIIGNNSRGKTTLLESIYLIIAGVGFREEKEEELISFGKDELSAVANFSKGKEKYSFQIKIIRRKDLTQKVFFIDKTPQKYTKYRADFPGVVLFTPEQIYAITGPPSARRDYFNHQLSRHDLEYKKHLTNYDSALRKRNKVLEKHVESISLKDELVFWNDYLEKEARYITNKRQLYVDFLNSNRKLDSKEFSIIYMKNEFNGKRLAEVIEKERILRRTLIGPQKDDFRILVGNGNDKEQKDVDLFGSRSEERLAIFWLKINELKFYELKKIKPILLLDDIFSELDETNQKIILELIKKYQTVTTTTETKIKNLVKLSDDGFYHTINL